MHTTGFNMDVEDCEEIYLCHKCGKIFYKLSTLESHSRWKHMEKTNEFMCDQCGRTFHKKYNLIKHLDSAVHEISESVKCALCDFKALNRKLMCEHYQRFHGILLKESNVYFKTADEFFTWKSEFENKTRSRFVKMSSTRKRKNGFMRSTYFCHRDGNFIPKGRNLRHMKVKGSNKINAHCPAKMDVEIGEKIVIVSYIDTHLGHDLDITRMNLDPADKALIAKKLALKVPFEQILDEINTPATKDGELKRVNLLTRKDLWNIVDTFKINPKNVIYSKNRLRKKKNMELIKKKPGRNCVYLKIFDEESNTCSSEENKVNYNVREEIYSDHQVISIKQEKFTGSEVISVKKEKEENVILCPIMIKDENDQYTQQYAVIPEENEGASGTCLIINSMGELESVSGHQIIYSAEGNVEVCQALDMDESEMDVDGLSVLENQTGSNLYKKIINEDENKSVIKDETLNKETEGDEQFLVEQIINQEQQEERECSTNLVPGDKVNNDVNTSFENKNITGHNMVSNYSDNNFVSEDGSKNTSIFFLDSETNELSAHQALAMPIKGISLESENSKYEVTDLNRVKENKYVIISSEKDSLNGCLIISPESSSQVDFDSPIYVTTVARGDEEQSTEGTDKGIMVSDLHSFEECVEVTEGGRKWGMKRQQALHKLMNVHNMINNERQLQVFSKNISSLENVLKTLSTCKEQEPHYSSGGS